MIGVPAHKQTDPAKLPGQIVNRPKGNYQPAQGHKEKK